MSTLVPSARQRARLFPFAAILLALCFGVALFADPGADPPFGPPDLEGQILLGARARVPGPDIPLGEWAPVLVSPSQTVLTAAVFRVAGTGLAAARGVSATVAVAVVLLFMWLVADSRGPTTALVAGLMLVTNAVFFGMARTALPAVFSLFWMLLALRLWSWSERRRWLALPAGAAVVWAGLFENGPRNAFFLGVGLLLLVFLRAHAWKMPWLPAVRRRIGLYWFGLGAMLVILLISVITRWREYGATWGHLSLGGFDRMPGNLLLAPVYFGRLFRFMPFTTLFVAATFLFFARDLIRPVARHRKVDEIGLGFLAWILVGGAAFVLLAAQSLDALVLLVPPFAVVAADGLRGLVSLRRISRPRIDIMIVMTAIAGVVWFVLAWLVHRHYDDLPLPDALREHQIRGGYALILTGWVFGTGLLGWLYLKWKRLVVSVRPSVVIAAASLLGLAIPLYGIGHEARWWRHRTHEVMDAGRRLTRELPAGAVVIGSWAPLLTLDTPAAAGVVMRGVNDTPEAWQDRVTHLLLDARTEGGPDSPPMALIARLGRGVAPVAGPDFEVGGRRLVLRRVTEPRRIP